MENKILYLCSTVKFSYYVIADDPTEAKTKVESMLNEIEYGFEKEREVLEIKQIAKQIMPALNYKYFLSGGDNLLI